MKQLVSDNHGKMIPVPNNMTQKFQPLDLTVNRSCKAFVQKESQTWYANQVQAQITNGVEPEKVAIGLKISTLKPQHCHWVTRFYDY